MVTISIKRLLKDRETVRSPVHIQVQMLMCPEVSQQFRRKLFAYRKDIILLQAAEKLVLEERPIGGYQYRYCSLGG